METEARNEAPAQSEAPVLINRYHFDEQGLRSSYQRLMRPYVLIQLIAAVLMLGLAAYYTVFYAPYFSQSKTILVLVLLLFGMAGFEAWRALNSVNTAVKRNLKRTEELYGVREYDVTLRFEETEIVTESSLSTEPGHMPYSGFTKLKRYPDLITIRTESRRLSTLDPDCFENGTEADFWRLMNKKCPAAVPKDRRG